MTQPLPSNDLQAALAAPGMPVEEPSYTPQLQEEAQVVDYWTGPPPPEKWYFPDGIQYIEYTKLTHGQRAEFNRRVDREILLEKNGGGRMKTDQTNDTNILIDIAATDWYVVRNVGGRLIPQPFSKTSPGSTLQQWLKQANPDLVDSLEKAVRSGNSWLENDITVEEIDKEIENLHERRRELLDRESSKKSSSDK